MKLTLIIAVLLVLALGTVELALRFFFGFGKPPLYVADTQTGYRLAPNQRTKRFGNVFAINQYSMRGEAIAPQPEADTLRVLLLGDSIANGGWWTDQSEILSQRLQQQLTALLPSQYTQVEVLNASANSWGPRNELAYILKFGTFESPVVVLLLNTDDLFATAPTSLQVGRDRAYPKRYPPLALVEVAGRFIKAPPIPELEAVRQEGGDRVGVNLEAVRQLQQLTNQANGRLIVAMTPLLREVQPPGPRDYEITARQRVTQFTEQAQIPYIDFLADFKTAADPGALYRDHIHLSPQGYTLVTQTLSSAVTRTLHATGSSSRRLPDTLLEDPW
ncbi:SGNH/GDSL hydrolase family protein [Halomicronema sp. CCY15110]|uniref:SGNH/GDSL hydrolase family protein n=1 Tax=Halomicronema sp. CCY15110 TaxID=2767773 RepID=UPI00194DBB60|nr:SGNH/GDSL hydrolase family protein [Halomicronema sp. CCY15110]